MPQTQKTRSPSSHAASSISSTSGLTLEGKTAVWRGLLQEFVVAPVAKGELGPGLIGPSLIAPLEGMLFFQSVQFVLAYYFLWVCFVSAQQIETGVMPFHLWGPGFKSRLCLEHVEKKLV